MLWNVWGGADIRCVQKEVERGSVRHKARSGGYGQVQSPDVHEGGQEKGKRTQEGVGRGRRLTCARGGCERG